MFLSAGDVSARGQKATAIDILFVENVDGGVSSRLGCLFLIGLEAWSSITQLCGGGGSCSGAGGEPRGGGGGGGLRSLGRCEPRYVVWVGRPGWAIPLGSLLDG